MEKKTKENIGSVLMLAGSALLAYNVYVMNKRDDDTIELSGPFPLGEEIAKREAFLKDIPMYNRNIFIGLALAAVGAVTAYKL